MLMDWQYLLFSACAAGAEQCEDVYGCVGGEGARVKAMLDAG